MHSFSLLRELALPSPGALPRPRPLLALGSRFVRRLGLVAVCALASALSSCIVTGAVITGYYSVSGGLDHDAHVSAAWRGPDGELALALDDLEGVCKRESTVFVLTAHELEQAFAGAIPHGTPLLPVAHVRLPRAILFRKIELAR